MLGPRVQPQSVTRLSALARSLGFTHAFNFGQGSTNATNIINGKQGMSLVSGASITGGQGGRAVQFTGTRGDRLEVSGNPFATSTCTFLWVDSGIDASTDGQCVTLSKYGASNLDEQFGLQIRNAGSAIRILSAQLAVKFTATNARDNTGKLNVTAVAINGDQGRHAVFNSGRLIAAGNPASSGEYRHGTSAIGGAFDVTSNTIRYHALLFAPRVVPDDALKYLTANPWAMFEDPSDDEELAWYAMNVSAATIAWSEADDTMAIPVVLTDRATVTWSETGDTMSAAATVTDRGAVAWAEQGDVPAIAVSVTTPPMAVSASLAWAEDGDAPAIYVRATARAMISALEQGDTWSLTAYAERSAAVRMTVRFSPMPRNFHPNITHFSNEEQA